MGSISKLSEKCKSCPNVDTCNHKRMELCAYIEPKNSADLTSPVLPGMVQGMVMKHDYRDVKVGENTKITIDVEELKRQIEEDFYRKLGIGFYPGA